jgi:peroxiredoxin
MMEAEQYHLKSVPVVLCVSVVDVWVEKQWGSVDDELVWNDKFCVEISR